MNPARPLLPVTPSATGYACSLPHWAARHSQSCGLDNQHRLIADDMLFLGTINSINVHPREVVKTGLKHNAAAAVLAHNHPSGHSEPSDADRRITERLKQALDLVDIRLLDHLVVGGMDIVSFAERGWL